MPTGEDEEVQSSEAKVGPYALQDFTLFHVLRHGFRPQQDRVPGLARVARRGRAATGRRGSRTTSGRPYTLAEIRQWLEVFVQRFSASASSSARRCRTGRRSVRGGSLSPRGDWRAPSDLPAADWLEEIRGEVPTE